jgi:hypothetical protein
MATAVRSLAQPLSRCCLEAIELRGPESPTSGDAVRCEWCDETAVFRDGEWTGTRYSGANHGPGSSEQTPEP